MRGASARLSRAGNFETTYIDARLRIARGDAGELRVFERVDEPGAGGALPEAGPGEGASAATSPGAVRGAAAAAGEAPPDSDEPEYWPYAEGEDPDDFVPAE